MPHMRVGSIYLGLVHQKAPVTWHNAPPTARPAGTTIVVCGKSMGRIGTGGDPRAGVLCPVGKVPCPALAEDRAGRRQAHLNLFVASHLAIAFSQLRSLVPPTSISQRLETAGSSFPRPAQMDRTAAYDKVAARQKVLLNHINPVRSRTLPNERPGPGNAAPRPPAGGRCFPTLLGGSQAGSSAAC